MLYNYICFILWQLIQVFYIEELNPIVLDDNVKSLDLNFMGSLMSVKVNLITPHLSNFQFSS